MSLLFGCFCNRYQSAQLTELLRHVTEVHRQKVPITLLAAIRGQQRERRIR